MISIIGSGGQLGSDLKSICKDRKLLYNAIDIPEIDISDKETILKYFNKIKPDIIVNCSAYTAVDKAEKEIDKAFKVNANGVENLAGLAKEFNIPIIHISTDYVFSGNINRPYKENDICDPQSVYGKSKLAGEIKLLKTCDKALIIRTSWLYGLNGQNFVKTMHQLMQEKAEINVVDDQYGSPTWSYDLANVIVDIFENNKLEKAFKNIYHFCNSGITDWYMFAREIQRLLKENKFEIKCERINPIPTSSYPTAAKRPPFSVLDTGKISSLLGNKPPFWKDSLARFMKKYKLGLYTKK